MHIGERETMQFSIIFHIPPLHYIFHMYRECVVYFVWYRVVTVCTCLILWWGAPSQNGLSVTPDKNVCFLLNRKTAVSLMLAAVLWVYAASGSLLWLPAQFLLTVALPFSLIGFPVVHKVSCSNNSRSSLLQIVIPLAYCPLVAGLRVGPRCDLTLTGQRARVLQLLWLSGLFSWL